MIRVLLADDHTLVRAGVRLLPETRMLAPLREAGAVSFAANDALFVRSLVCPRPGATLQLKVHLGAGEHTARRQRGGVLGAPRHVG